MGRFYMHRPLRFKDYSSRRFFVSILLGIVTMVIFYLFQQYLFILFRSTLLAHEYNVNHLLSKDFGDLVAMIFAGNAVILGNSVGIAFYISGVSKTTISRLRKRNVLNNQSFLIGTHFYLFIKVIVSIGVLLMLLSKLIFLESIWSVCVLLFVVLFLESVKELRRSFKGYTIKVLMLHFILVVGLMFVCSRLNTSAYYKLGIVYNTSHPYVYIPTTTYEIETYDDPVISPYNNYFKIPVKVLSDSNNLKYILYDNELTIHELIEMPYSKKHNPYGMRYGKNPKLTIHAEGALSYSRLKELESKAMIRGIDKLNYVIHSTINDEPFIYTKTLYPTKEIFEEAKNQVIPPPPDILYIDTFLKDKEEIEIVLDAFKVNNQVDEDKVYSYFQESVSDSVFFKLNISKEVTLQDYLDFMIAYKESVYDLREEQRRRNQALNIYKESGVKKKYPFMLIEEIE